MTTPPPAAAGRLVSSARVAGAAVYSPGGERLGHIDDLMIDKPSGRIAYAVLAFGGFLGFNDKHHPLPWSALRYDLRLDGYVVDLDRTTLLGAPTFSTTSEPALDPAGWTQVDDYYGTSPFDQDVPLDATATPVR